MNVFGHSVSFWKTIFQFLWKNIFDPGNLPNSGSKSSKSISSIFACKIDLKWCIFVTYAKISIYFGQNCWKCSENPHISQIKRKNISRISREIQAKISRETGREFSGISREFPGGNSRDGNPNHHIILVNSAYSVVGLHYFINEHGGNIQAQVQFIELHQFVDF